MRFFNSLLVLSFNTWLISVFLEQGLRLWLDWRHDETSNLCMHVLQFAFAVSMMLIYFKTIASEKPRSLFTKNLEKKYIRTSIGRQLIAKFVASALLIISVFNSFQASLKDGGELVAITLDSIGQYEIGELVYAACTHIRDNSLASLVHGRTHDLDRNEIKAQRLNKWVAQVYGSCSRQMARRYMILGIHLQTNFADYKGAADNYKKASELYSQLSDARMRISALSFLAVAQSEGEPKEVIKTLQIASTALPSGDIDYGTKGQIAVLWSLARKAGQKRLQLAFLRGIGSNSYEIDKYHPFPLP